MLPMLEDACYIVGGWSLGVGGLVMIGYGAGHGELGWS